MVKETGGKRFTFSIDSILSGTFERGDDGGAGEQHPQGPSMDPESTKTMTPIEPLQHTCICCCYCSHCGEIIQADYLPTTRKTPSLTMIYMSYDNVLVVFTHDTKEPLLVPWSWSLLVYFGSKHKTFMSCECLGAGKKTIKYEGQWGSRGKAENLCPSKGWFFMETTL